MARVPRLLPLVAIAIGGVLAVGAVRGAPSLIGAAQSFAEDAGSKGGKPAVSPTASINNPTQSTAPAAAAPVCAPTASELAKEAGLSPAELQVLQSLGSRRGELDQREQGLDTQVQLIAAAEAKLDDRIKEMNSLKGNIQDLLGQANAQQQAETDQLVVVYSKMKPAAAAARMTLMDDSVRLPMAAKMKPAILAVILANMPPEDAKNVTEKLAQRVNGSQAVMGAQAALNPSAAPPAATPAKTQAAGATPPSTAAAAATPPQVDPTAKPARAAKARPHRRPKPKAPASDIAANDATLPLPAGPVTPKAAVPTSAAKPAAATGAAAPTAPKAG